MTETGCGAAVRLRQYRHAADGAGIMSAPAVKTVAILGAGHGGCAAAADLTRRGYAVRLQARNPERLAALRESGGIEARGIVQGFVPIADDDDRRGRGGRGADLIMLVVPSVAHEPYAARARAAPRRQPADLPQSRPHRRRPAFPARAAPGRPSRPDADLRDRHAHLRHAHGRAGDRRHLQLHQAPRFRGPARQARRPSCLRPDASRSTRRSRTPAA